MAEPIPIPAAGFEGRNLSLRPAGLWKGAAILCDGQPAPRKGRTFTLNNNAGAPVTMKFTGNFLDPIPRIDAGGQVIQLAPPFAWWEYVLIAMPMVLLIIGGAVGGVCGAVAAYSNAQVLRLQMPLGLRIVLCFVVLAGATVVLFCVAILLRLLLGTT